METIPGIIGLLIITVAVWQKNEVRQDVLFVIGGLLMLAYSIAIRNTIFSLLQIVFVVSASVEMFRLQQQKKK